MYENNYENYEFCYISASEGRFPWGQMYANICMLKSIYCLSYKGYF